jgi:hypothetical protein
MVVHAREPAANSHENHVGQQHNRKLPSARGNAGQSRSQEGRILPAGAE